MTERDQVVRLLEWFDRDRRALPWRRSSDPYRVWLSEVMLQQTRVDVVVPYYERFLARFPTVEALAAADLDEVLALWSGLGYYRRARQLHAAAGEVVRRGGFPSTPEGLAELPGIGGYTAAAVASICFGVVAPVLDGNVERVVARLLGEEGDVKRSAIRRRLLERAATLLDPTRPGDSNQALMELGATVCSPRRPRCLLCPLGPDCVASRRGDAESLPRPREKRASVQIEMVAAVVEEVDGRVLLCRRAEESDLLAGIWEIPWVERGDDDPADGLARRYGGRFRLGARLGSARHGITFRDLAVEVYRAELLDGGSLAEGVTAAWLLPEQVGQVATSSLVGKILALLGEKDAPSGRGLRAGRRLRPPR